MRKFNELKYTDLKTVCDPSIFKFKTTEDLEDMQDGLRTRERHKSLRIWHKC